MTTLKLEDPTVDVMDIEEYRLAFLMQFFVQHKHRFRFPRLRLQDLYQRVVKDSDPTAFCDLVARILRFLSHGDPEIKIDTVDHALDKFTVDKRTPYRINMQRHRNGKPVHQLGPTARAALLENLIESVYDEQPDFNFTSGLNSSTSVTGGLSNGVGGRSTNGSATLDQTDSETGIGGGQTTGLFGHGDQLEGGGEFSEPEDVSVLIKAGQDAQGCSYYYMDDLRLYRERPQNGLSSLWDVAVGPTAAQWQAFIASLSRNEKEYDLYCFLKQDLFELVKESLDVYELHSHNSELDSGYLRAKEANELAELKRRRCLNSSKNTADSVDSEKLPLNMTGLGATGPKSASPAFSGGHGTCGVGSSGSSTSGAPLTPSSARTPTSAPPATTSSGCPPHFHQQQSLPESCISEMPGVCVKSDSRIPSQPVFQSQPNNRRADPVAGKIKIPQPTSATDFVTTNPNKVDTGCLDSTASTHQSAQQSIGDNHFSLTNSVTSCSSFPNPQMSGQTAAPAVTQWSDLPPVSGSVKPEQQNAELFPDGFTRTRSSGTEDTDVNDQLKPPLASSGPSQMIGSQMHANETCSVSSSWPSPTRLGSDSCSSAVSSTTSVGLQRQQSASLDSRVSNPSKTLGGTVQPINRPEAQVNNVQQSLSPSSAAILAGTPQTVVQPVPSTPGSKLKGYPPEATQVSREVSMPPDCGTTVRPKGNPVRSVQPSECSVGEHGIPGPVERQHLVGSKQAPPVGPATALVPPMVGPVLTQEQWENRKSKIAQLEKIHSTLSKSKSASTPGAVAAAAGAVLQQQQRMQCCPNGPPLPPYAGPQNPCGISQQSGMPMPGNFGPSSYSGPPPSMVQRQAPPETYCATRPGRPPCEVAQREWDRLCMDYQREKTEFPGPRFYAQSKQAALYDPNGCPLLPSDVPPGMSPQSFVSPNMPANSVMMPSGPVMMDQVPCQSPGSRQFMPHLDGSNGGSGPPIVMVPPNNSNLNSSASAYSSPMPGSVNMPSAQHYRSAASMGGATHMYPDQFSGGPVPPGQKRPYRDPGMDPWMCSNSANPVLGQISPNENGLIPGPLQSGTVPAGASSFPGSRVGPIGNIGPTPLPSVINPGPMTTSSLSTTVGSVNSAGGKTGTGKSGGKKRKTAGSGRASSTGSSISASAAITPQPQPPYGRQPNSLVSGPVNPNKPPYPMQPYMGADPIQSTGGPPHSHRAGYISQTVGPHPHLNSQCGGPHSSYPGMDPYGAHYPDMPGDSMNVGRPMVGVSCPMENRRALTPKSAEMFSMGGMPGGPTMACGGGGRLSSANFGGMGGMPPGTSPMMHSYIQSSDGLGPNYDPPPGGGGGGGPRSLQSASCTQHLTSASLASLARLSQMSGPEGPYIPSSSSAPSSMGSTNVSPMSASGAYVGGRNGSVLPYHGDGTPAGLPVPPHPSQTVRSHGGIGPKAALHEPPDLPNGVPLNYPGAPHTLSSSPSLHSKFGAQPYQSSHSIQQQAMPSGMIPTHPPQPLPQGQQQPPSIQVNNTFFNAQLNVQQMNYQHVSAPGSTGQMQIHFVQQQQQQQQQQDPSGGAGIRSGRQAESVSRMSGGNNNGGPDFYPSSTGGGGPENTNATHRVPGYSASAVTGTENMVKPDGSSANSGSVPISSSNSATGVPTGATAPGGYGNTSVQITPRTPHTIQYLPAVTPHSDSLHGSQQQQYMPPGPPHQLSRSGNTRGVNNSQYGAPDQMPSGPPDGMSATVDPGSVASSLRQPPFHSGPVYSSHSQAVPGPQSQQHFQQQQQYSSQQSVQSSYSTQTISSSKTSQQQLSQTVSGRLGSNPNSGGSGWGNGPQFDSSVSGSAGPYPTGPLSKLEPSSQATVNSAGSGMRSSGSSNQSVRNGTGNYPPNAPNYQRQPMDASSDTVLPAGFTDATMMSSTQRVSTVNGQTQQYTRQQSSTRYAAYEQNTAQSQGVMSGSTPVTMQQQQQQQQQQQVYRQQQQQQNYSSQHQTTQQQQHQMFMSSSMSSNYSSSDGTTGSQTQFMMSASASSSSMNSSTVQNSSSTIVSGTEFMGSGGPVDVKCGPFDPMSKRSMIMGSAADETKLPLDTMNSFNSGQTQQLVQQQQQSQSSGRMNWQSSVPSQSCPSVMDQHLNGPPYPPAYTGAGYAPTGPLPVGFADASGGQVGHSVNCELSASSCMQPQTYSAPMVP